MSPAHETTQTGNLLAREVRNDDVATAGSENPEPCPTPLAWDEVLNAYRTEADHWELQRGERTLRGRTWGNGPPVYLLPGLGGTHELYALLTWLLRDDFRCVAFNHTHAKYKHAVTAGDLADDLFAVADEHRDRQFRVYAPAFGSVSALTAMLAEPDRIHSAVLQSGFAHRKLSVTERLLIQLGLRLRRESFGMPFRETLQTQNHRPWFPPLDHGRWQFFLDDTGRVPVSMLAQRAAVLRHFDLRDRLGDVAQPVMLVRTEGEGQVAGHCQDLLEDRLPNVVVERLHSSGQLPFLTHPHRLVKLIRSFFVDEETRLDAAQQKTDINF